MRSARWGWAGALALLLQGAAACGGGGDSLEIRDFSIESTDPPADVWAGGMSVSRGATVGLRWSIRGTPDRLVLTANDHPVIEFERGSIPRSWQDACGESACSTGAAGDLVYRLAAFRGSEMVAKSLPLRVADQALRVSSFTSRPESIAPGSDVSLSWRTVGASEATLTATPIGGGEARTLGTFRGSAALQGAAVDPAVGRSTLYRLEIRNDLGETAQAEVAVPLAGESFFTSIAADPAGVAPGQETTLRWTSTGLERLLVIRDDGAEGIDDVGPDELASGARTVRIYRETTFTFVGVSTEGAVVTDLCDDTGCRPAKLTIGLQPGPTITRFDADLREIPAGSGTTLRWTVSNADEVVISWADGTGNHEQRFGPAVAEMPVDPADTIRYTLVAHGGGRIASAAFTLGVKPALSVNVGIDPVYGGAYAGEELELAWTTLGAALLDVRVDGSPVALGGAPIGGGSVLVPVPPDAAEGSQLAVQVIARDDETPRRTNQVSQLVTVHRKPKVDDVAFTPNRVSLGESSQLAWSTSDAESVLVMPPPATTFGVEPWVDLGAGDTDVTPSAVDGSTRVALPFAWNGFDRMQVHENGLITFGNATTLEAISGGAAVAPFFADLALRPGSRILVRETGTAPGRRVIVEWSGLRLASGTLGSDADDLTFEAVIREDDHVQVSWKRLSLGSGGDPSTEAKIGASVDWPSVGGPFLTRWAANDAGAAVAGERLLFATARLPANGSITVFARSNYGPTLHALGVAAPSASVAPPALRVDR